MPVNLCRNRMELFIPDWRFAERKCNFAFHLFPVRLKILVFSLFVLGISSYGQNTLLLHKLGSAKKYTYEIGDEISLKTLEKKLRLKGTVIDIRDSSFMVGIHYSVKLNDVDKIYRRLHFPRLMSKFFLIAGGGYIILDAFNNLINNRTVIDSQTLIIGGSLIGVGLVMIPLSYKHVKVGLRWKLQALDLPVP
jgi:hypothetical protein